MGTPMKRLKIVVGSDTCRGRNADEHDAWS